MLPPSYTHTPKNKTGKKNQQKQPKQKATKTRGNKITKTKKRTKQIKQINKQTNKQKTSHQLWCQNLWLRTVALDICHRHLTLSLTTVDSSLTGVICEIVNPQRPDQDWQAPLQCFLWKLGSCRGVNSWRSREHTQSPYLDWGNMWGRHTQRQC